MMALRESNLYFALPDAALPPIQSNEKIVLRACGDRRRCVRERIRVVILSYGASRAASEQRRNSAGAVE
jgi:hypothetical protein